MRKRGSCGNGRHSHPDCGSGGGDRARDRGGRGRGHVAHHLSGGAQHDFLQEMVSASPWAEPFLCFSDGGSADVTGGEKYF